ncbi:hypothetical protein [Peribacillus asahii]|uniref:hypothetical protein n=1 Tax=Peribacillus asahii TaxID=228899 RepID=UPI0038089ED6
MADIKNLEEKVAKAEAKVEKCKGTIERHKKQLDKKIQIVINAVGVDLTGKTSEEIDELREPYIQTEDSWKFYDVKSKLDDIKGATKKLADAEQILANWNEKLHIEINREKFIQEQAPQVIKDFLEQWKQMAYEWNVKRYNDYQDLKEKLRKEAMDTIVEFIESHPEDYERYLGEDGKIDSYYADDYHLSNIGGRSLKAHLEEKELDYRSIQSRKSDFAGSTVMYMDTIYKEEERLAWLDKTLEQEKKRKMIDLIHRISKVTGEITDASLLKINVKGNLDGFVTGEKGKAKVETIGAGGWNIQVFHFRTLVHPVK